MSNAEIIQQWIDNDEILDHIDELDAMEFTPEIIGLLSKVDFSIANLPNNILLKIKIINENLIKANKRIECEKLQNQKQRIIAENGKMNIKLIDTEISSIQNKYFNKNIAMCYHQCGDDINAYKFFTIAQNQGLDCSAYLQYYESLFSKKDFQNVTKVIEESIAIYDSNKNDKILAVQEYGYDYVEKYTYYLQGEIEPGSETNLKDSLGNYLIDKAIGKNIDNCSSYTYLLTSGVEGLLKTFYYKPYIIYLESEYNKNPEDESIKNVYSKMTNKIVRSANLFDFYFTLGTFYSMCGSDHFLQWIQNNYNGNLTRSELNEFREEINSVMTFWRNPTIHTVYTEEWKFKYLLNKILLKDDCLISKIIKYVNYAEYNKENDISTNISEVINKLQKFIQTNGRYPRLSSQDKEELKLAKMVYEIRKSKKGNGYLKLSNEMIDKLNDLNFEWESEKLNWFDIFFEKLLAYKNKHKSFAGVTQDQEIGVTVQSIRRQLAGANSVSLIRKMIDKRLVLTTEQIEQLAMIDFPFTTNKSDWFTQFYEELILYRGLHGNFVGVSSDREIGTMVAKVRQAKKGKGSIKLTEEMIDKLNDIGFPWEGRPKKQKGNDLSL